MEYGKVENGLITSWYTLGDDFVLPDGTHNNGDPVQLAALNYLPLIPDPEPTHFKWDRNLDNAVISGDHITYGLIPWTQEEIAAEELREANEDLLTLQRSRAELSFWRDKTPEEIIELVAATPSTYAGFRANDEKLALAVEALTKIVDLWVKTGRVSNGQ